MSHKHYVQRVIGASETIPEGYVLERELGSQNHQFNKRPDMVSPDLRLYRNALKYANQGLIPSIKVMRTTTDKHGPVLFQTDWRNQTKAILERNLARVMAPVEVQAEEVKTAVIDTAAQDKLTPTRGLKLLEELNENQQTLIALQRETLQALNRLATAWSV